MGYPPHKLGPLWTAGLVAIAELITLVVLLAMGVLQSMPGWAVVVLVTTELLAPLMVYLVMRRQMGE